MPMPRAKPPGSWIVGSILLAVFTGCAYYNTFYLAKRYYREAQRAQERSVTDTTTPEAAAKYDATIRQCAKIVVDYEKSKWVDDAIYLMGASMYGKGDYAGAIKKFGELRAIAPKSPFVPDSKLMEALSRLKRKEYTEAQSLFREVDGQYPSFRRGWELYFHAGECEAGLKNYDAALTWYERATKAARQRRERADAMRRIGDALVAAKRYDEAQAVYAECLKVEERGGRRLDLALKRGGALQELKRFDEALAFYESWKGHALAEKRDGEVYLRIGECMALTGRVKEAIEGYGKIVTQFPRTSAAYEAQFRIGYLYESQLGDLDAAGREYEKLKSEPPSEFATQASRRASNLSAMSQYRHTLLTDTTQARPRAAFLLAELYYFQLEKLDSALIQYAAVERDFPTSPYAPKAGFARLWIVTHDRGDTAAAAALTDSVATRYRRTRYAESALYLWKRWSGRTDERTALLDSMLANPDTTIARERLEALLEPSAPATPQLADSASARLPIRVELTPAEKARLDSLATYTRALLRAQRGEKTPAEPPPVPVPAVADTSQTRIPPAAPLDPDSSSAPVIGPVR